MAEPPISPATAQRVRFHYIKSNFFRVIHVDGCIGALTPQGLIHAAIYSERPAIPQVTEHEVDEEAHTLRPAASIEGRQGFVREVECDLMLSRGQAIALRDWLDVRIKELDAVLSTPGGKDS